jgi:VWFA-related protein
MYSPRSITCIILLAFVYWLGATAARAQEDQSSAIKLQSTLVSVPVIVSDREGRYVGGLKMSDFTLYKDRKPQTIAAFDSIEEPLNVAILLDTSKSTRNVLDKIKDAATDFLKTLRPQDRAMIVSFDYEAHVLSALTSDRKALERAIKRAEIGFYPGTTLRDAIVKVTSESFREIKGRKAIVLLTDGKDHGSRISEEELLDSAAESDAMIYSIFYGTGIGRASDDRPRDRFPRRRRGGWRRRGGVSDPPPQMPDRRRRRERMEQKNEDAEEFLTELSEVSAGRFYSKDVTDLKETFTLIAEELRHQYRLGFYASDDKPDGSLHRLTVQVARPGAVVRARNSYRAAQTD